MVWRLYVVPIIGGGTSLEDAYRPKYVAAAGVPWSWMPADSQGWGLVRTDVTTVQHNQLSAQPDVISFPAALSNTISPVALAEVQASLEALDIPAEWVTTSYTYRDIAEALTGWIQFLQRWSALVDLARKKLFNGTTVTMDTQWGDLPLAVRQYLAGVAQDMNLDTSQVTATTTMRQIARGLWQQLSARVAAKILNGLT